MDRPRQAHPDAENLAAVEGRIKEPTQFGRLIVAQQGGAPVYLSQVADVLDGEKEETSLARTNGDSSITVWGTGQPTREFLYVRDCAEGIVAAMERYEGADPVNLGSTELVTINEMVDIVEDIAGVKLEREYDLSAPQGVRGRSSDNTEILKRYGWEPSITLADGLERTYRWIFDELKASLGQ